MSHSPGTTVVLLVLVLLGTDVVPGASGQLPSNPYYGNGLLYPTKNAANPFVYANTASYANTYYLPYAYQSYAPFAPLRTGSGFDSSRR